MSKTTYGPIQADGSQAIFVDGRPFGRLMPTADDTALGGDIAPTSKPAKFQGTVNTRMLEGNMPRLADPASILSFSDYWARHYHHTYPFHDDGK